MRRNSNERLYLRGRVWWTWVYDTAGVRHDISTKCRDRAAGSEVAARLERDAANPLASTQGAATVQDACDLYRNNKRGLIKRDKRSAASLEFFQTKIGHLERILGGALRLVDLAPRHLDAYVEARELEPGARTGSNITAHTIKKELVAFRQALELAQRAGIYSGLIDPLFPPDHTAEYVPRDRALDRSEVAILVRSLMPDPQDIYRKSLKDGDHAARVAFLVATAARWSGAARCRREDVAPDLSWVQLRETKTDRAYRKVPIVTTDQKALLRFALDHAAGTDGLLFRPWESVNRDFVKACKRAGIPRCSPNDLRRTMALWLRAAGVPAEVVGMILGHTTARMVETVYARLQRRPEELARLIESHLKVESDCSAIAAIRVDSSDFTRRDALAAVSQVLDIRASLPEH